MINTIVDKLKSYFPYILGFIIISCIIFYPELQGKKLGANDSVTYWAASKEYRDYEQKGETIRWTNRIFSGMPLASIIGESNGNFINYNFFYFLYNNNLTNIQILLLAFIVFFISLIHLKVDRLIAFILSIGFGLNTWLLGSLYASHPTKIVSMIFLVPIIVGLIQFYKSKNLISLAYIGVGLMLTIGSGHYQIVYYGAIICGIIALYYFINAVRTKELKSFISKSLALLVICLVSVSTNIYHLKLINEYNKETMRGGKTEITKKEANSTSEKGGLDINYAFSWSYSWSELANFIIPDAMGGSSNYSVKTKKSKLAQAINSNEKEMALPMYWGIQPFTGGPNYLGASLFFVFLFIMILWKDKIKYIFLSLFILSVFMGLGRSFLGFNEILFDYLPLYNKFRTPTMSFAILNIIYLLTIGIGLNSILQSKINKEELVKAFKHTGVVYLGLVIISFLLVNAEGYSASSDMQYFANNMNALDLLKEDRASFFKSDIIRTLFLACITASILYFHLINRISKNVFYIVFGIIVLFDMYTIHLRYDDNSVFTKVDNIEELIPNESYNQYLEQDKSHFRIFNTANQNIFNDNTDGYRFSNIGGYSPAKLYRYQDLIDVHLSKGNMPVLNMLNTKYFIVNQNGQKFPQQNPDACGNAWFVKEVKFAENANEEIDSIGNFNPKTTAWVDKRYASDIDYKANLDSTASINLIQYHPDNMVYESNSKTGGYAVFSEIWYKGNEDWKIYINGKESKMVRTDYILRGAYIPAGKNKIEMKFGYGNMQPYKYLTILTTILICILILLPFAFYYKKLKKNQLPTP